MRLPELIAGLAVEALGEGWESVRVCDLTEDSRTAVPGSLFIARAGLKHDGRAFAAEAVEAGASAILTDDPGLIGRWGSGVPVLVTRDLAVACGLLAERFHGNPSSRLGIVAVTGTNGKSTVTHLVWRMANRAGTRCGLIGTVLTDDGREVARSSMTTPPAIELSRALASMTDGGCVAAAIEASSHALHQRRTEALVIKVAVFTNLTGDHLDYHSTMDAYADAKARLFETLDPSGVAVVNAQDPYAGRVTSHHRGRRLACSMWGDEAKAEDGSEPARARILSASMEGMRLLLEGPWGSIECHVPLIGRYNAMNVLQATAACHALGISTEGIRSGLSAATAPPGRLEAVGARGVDGPRVYVDYAHSDDSLRNVLTAVRGAMREQPGSGRLWVVFGCGGDKDRTKRPRMGRAAAELADVVVVTSDNPRSESPGAIIKEILEGVPASRRDKIVVHPHREQAIAHAVRTADDRDVVVIAGKGHETEQIRAGVDGSLVAHHFDDREHAVEALAGRSPGTPDC
ncbi:MAG: UDP-N-acetylmuramoyl-L-alanyl-D-glutamate--2,6-diaminopimelate ligase [Phycisphaeraceae bacterium]|nr:UDP-N-acetylmuramoyl-L-alanyl-D-glutamate--2,6-diaminopimelate ligase [Phycisphaerae bacterium]MBX3393436.1 UDP-N-acetylmuramoyl-L-alanyl-D-glutamate--2,6-diaminopimelate ligase [Phycisphaeraceae bacterium]